MLDAIAGHSPTEGEMAARFRLLYVIYGRRLRGYITAYLGRYDYHLAGDLAGETWHEVARSLPSLSMPDDRAFAWLAAVARRTVCRHYIRTRTNSGTGYAGPVRVAADIPRTAVPA